MSDFAPMRIFRVLPVALLALGAPSLSSALTLAEFYKVDPRDRAWYIGGIYDANIVEWGRNGQRSNCLESLGLEGLTKKLSEFVVALPSDPSANERKIYDAMNVALLAALVIDKECKS